jgi:hypothetical protein
MREKRRGRRRGVQGLLQDVSSTFSGKQEVASGSPAQDTQQLAAYWKKKEEFLQRTP